MATPPFQQLRSASAGTHPPSLEPGQIAFNLADSAMYLGNGGNANQLADAAATAPPAPPAGKGWIQFKLKIADIAAALLAGTAPLVVADSRSLGTPVAPTAGQLLTWDDTVKAYLPKTPGAVKVLSLTKTAANAGTDATATLALVAALTSGGKITASADLHAGDQVIVTDDGSADRVAAPGGYVWDGAAFIGLPSGGGAKVVSDLLNVTVAPVPVAAADVGGFLVRDMSVAAETDPGAWKVTTAIDMGIY